jgi:MtaA/CmuA family methyltransferase
MTGRERLFAVYQGKEVDHLPLMPITMMFAGDWLGVNYRQYVTEHQILAAAQMKLAADFDFDYVSVISDPAREAADLGATVEWFDNQPPAIVESQALLSDKTMLAKLNIPDPLVGKRMSDRIRGVELLRKGAGGEKLIEGWVEGPCALAADLRGLNTLMTDFFDDPGFVHSLFEFAVEVGRRFGLAQKDAGADLIGVGDAAASLVGPRLYQDFVVSYERQLVQALQKEGALVRLHICGNTRRIFPAMASVRAEQVDLDWMAPIREAREQMGPAQVLAGNIDPVRVLRNGTPDLIETALSECHRQAGGRYIVSAGCEVPRGTPAINLQAMVEYARNHAP